MRNDKSGEKREKRISDRFNRGNNVDRSVIDYLNSGVSKCGYGTEEKQDKVQIHIMNAIILKLEREIWE